MRPLLAGLIAATAALAANANKVNGPVTFNKDVLPVLQKNCQSCHRPGEAAPMSFITYRSTRPWAKAIKEAVRSKRMPPWFADPSHGKWANDRTLSDADKATLTSWADSGAAEGSPKDAPMPVKFVDGWNIGTPDMLLEMPVDYEVPADGTIEYTYFVIPTGFTEDKWVQLSEIRPGNRQVVHHVIAFIRPPNSKWLADAKVGEAFVPKKAQSDGAGGQRRDEGGMGGNEWLTGYAPGTIPDVLKPGQGRLIKAGSDIVLQMHYTTNGKAAIDRTKVGIIFAKEPPKERVFTLAVTTNKFAIPANAASHRVDASLTIQADTKMVSLLPHMHLRGKSFEYRAVYPTGETQVLLSVPRYDFNWQLSYLPEKPIMLPKGTKLEATAHYDNSANNPANPNPNIEVRYGDQSWEEMMFGFFEVVVDPNSNPFDVVRPPRQPQRSGD